MPRIGVWKTFSGAAFVTHDAIGFGFYDEKDIPKLQADLEMGMGANQAAGFSGNVYPLNRVRKIEINESRKRVVITFRDLILSDKDDLNFNTLGACREFCDSVLENLGPGWVRGPLAKRNFWFTAIPIVLAAVLIMFLAVAIGMMLAGPEPVVQKDGKVRTQAESIAAGLTCGGVSIVGLVVMGLWIWWAIWRPREVDAIFKLD